MSDLTPSDGKLTKALLSSDLTYLLQTPSKLMIWVGGKAPLDSKRGAMASTMAFIKAVRVYTYIFFRAHDIHNAVLGTLYTTLDMFIHIHILP